jgi:hypothetical protein
VKASNDRPMISLDGPRREKRTETMVKSHRAAKAKGNEYPIERQCSTPLIGGPQQALSAGRKGKAMVRGDNER